MAAWKNPDVSRETSGFFLGSYGKLATEHALNLLPQIRNEGEGCTRQCCSAGAEPADRAQEACAAGVGTARRAAIVVTTSLRSLPRGEGLRRGDLHTTEGILGAHIPAVATRRDILPDHGSGIAGGNVRNRTNFLGGEEIHAEGVAG